MWRWERLGNVCRLFMRANEACLSCRLVGESDEGERSRDLSEMPPPPPPLSLLTPTRCQLQLQLQLQPYAGSV